MLVVIVTYAQTYRRATSIQPVADSITIISYGIFAYQTEESDNQPISLGVSPKVMAIHGHTIESGTLLGESLLGKIFTGSSPEYALRELGDVYDYYLKDDGKIGDSNHTRPKHNLITYDAPANPDSPVAKIMYYPVNDNSKLSLEFQANELHWDATAETANAGSGWGDTIPSTDYTNAHGEMVITDSGTGTHKDKNGHDVNNVVHKLGLDFAWIDGE